VAYWTKVRILRMVRISLSDWAPPHLCALPMPFWKRLWKEFEDTKGVIRNRKSKKNRQHNDKKKKDKMINKDQVTQPHSKVFFLFCLKCFFKEYTIWTCSFQGEMIQVERNTIFSL
jgi:hypothetical protein